MTAQPKITKEQLLKTIDNLKKSPNDRLRILGDIGIASLGGGLGVAAAGTLASAAGATSIFGLTSAAHLLGVTLVGATPIGWVLGVSAAGAAAAYGVSRLIRGGSISEGRKKELLEQYSHDLKNIEAKERAEGISDDDKTNFIVSLRELIDKDILLPEKGHQLIEFVEQGRIPLSDAVIIIQDLLNEKHTNRLDEIKRKADENVGSLDQQLQNNRNLLKELIIEIESRNALIQQHNELLLRHDQTLIDHGQAFQTAQEYVSSLEGKLHQKTDIINELSSQVESNKNEFATTLGKHSEAIRIAEVNARKIKLQSYFAISVSLVSAALIVALLIK